jgi:hypothetical protein
MKTLLIVGSVLLVAGCNTTDANRLVPDTYLKSPQGAGFSPYSVAEYNARADAGQPGTVAYNPYPGPN